MTKIYSTIALVLLTVSAFSQSRRLIKATTSGNWNAATTWTTTGSPTTPSANDSIVIAAGVNVTLISSATVTNSVLDIFGTLTINEANGASQSIDLNMTTNTTLPVVVIRIAGSGSIVKGIDRNGVGQINVVVNGNAAQTQLKYSTQPPASETAPAGQANGPVINGPAFAQNVGPAGNPKYFTTGSAAALPVSIGLFKATAATSGVTLNWTSLQEINAQLYIIEKSGNGTNWQEIGSVPANGFSGVATNYQFSDSKATEVNFYRIKVIDNDGKYKYTNTLTVRTLNKDINVSIFPNPAVNSVNISIGQQLAKQGFTVHVMNHNGQLISRRQVVEGTSALSFDVSTFKTGTYTFDIQFTGGTRESHKLVIVK